MREPDHGATRARLAHELEELASQSQLRHLALPLQSADASGRVGIDLMSNDYLSLSRHPHLRRAALKAIGEGEAMASTGSRLLSGNARAWEELEAEFAAFAGAEAALFFNSGYAANLGLLGSMLRPEDVVFSDSSNHASLIDGMRLSRARKIIFPHLDLSALEDHLRRAAMGPGEKFIVVESVFSMEGDRAPLKKLAALAAQYGAELIVDEAHATGVFGPEGRGFLAEAGLSRVALAGIFTCSKALASCGAFVACSATLKQFLVNRARTFIFSTALPPYMAHQIRAAMELARQADEQRLRLHDLSSALRAKLKEAGLNMGAPDSQIVPVLLGSNDLALEAARNLELAGFSIRAIRPPTVPPGTARLRISMNAELSIEAVERVAQALSGCSRTAHCSGRHKG
ncbi:MAG: aminotransferase class I/II-fold pyridoxal phosphate-dependent enzyme [Terriglobia bacterium]